MLELTYWWTLNRLDYWHSYPGQSCITLDHTLAHSLLNLWPVSRPELSRIIFEYLGFTILTLFSLGCSDSKKKAMLQESGKLHGVPKLHCLQKDRVKDLLLMRGINDSSMKESMTHTVFNEIKAVLKTLIQ